MLLPIQFATVLANISACGNPAVPACLISVTGMHSLFTAALWALLSPYFFFANTSLEPTLELAISTAASIAIALIPDIVLFMFITEKHNFILFILIWVIK